MATLPVESIVEQIKALPLEDQIAVAEAIDRLTWAQRWRRVCERIEVRAARQPEVGDEQVDEAVHAVRREKSLSERSSTHRS